MNIRLEHHPRLILVAIAALALSGAAACDSSDGTGKDEDTKSGTAGSGSRGSAANGADDDAGALSPDLAAECEDALRQAVAEAEQGVELSDAQIAAVVRDANLGEIAHGELALLRAENGDVRDFASRMVSEHGAANEALYDLLAMLRLKSEENPVSAGLTGEAMRLLDALTPLTGPDFDRAYINAQVQVHTAVLAIIERSLLPSADNDQLRAYLQTVHTAVMQHLQAARTIQTGLLAADGG